MKQLLKPLLLATSFCYTATEKLTESATEAAKSKFMKTAC